MSGWRVKKSAGPIVSLPIAWISIGFPSRDTRNIAPCFVIPATYKSLYIQFSSWIQQFRPRASEPKPKLRKLTGQMAPLAGDMNTSEFCSTYFWLAASAIKSPLCDNLTTQAPRVFRQVFLLETYSNIEVMFCFGTPLLKIISILFQIYFCSSEINLVQK